MEGMGFGEQLPGAEVSCKIKDALSSKACDLVVVQAQPWIIPDQGANIVGCKLRHVADFQEVARRALEALPGDFIMLAGRELWKSDG